jgi:hypothetical protein
MDADMTHRRIVVVLGMHRSGTSAIARGVKALGVDLGTRLMAPAAGNNDRGFWEDVDISRLNGRVLAALGCDWDSIRWIVPSDFASRKLERLQFKAGSPDGSSSGSGIRACRGCCRSGKRSSGSSR